MTHYDHVKRMPCPLHCGCNAHVISGGWAATRKVFTLSGYYLLVSKVYVCLDCQAAGRAPYTFRGWDPRLLKPGLLPEAVATDFPCVVGRKSAMDRTLHALQTCVLSEGFAMKAFRRVLMDVARQEYYQKAIGYYDYATRERQGGHVIGATKSGWIKEFPAYSEEYGGVEFSTSKPP